MYVLSYECQELIFQSFLQSSHRQMPMFWRPSLFDIWSNSTSLLWSMFIHFGARWMCQWICEW